MNVDLYAAALPPWRSQAAAFPPADQVLWFLTGLQREGGALLNVLHKVVFHAHTLDLDVVRDACGDFLFYLASGCSMGGGDFPLLVRDAQLGAVPGTPRDALVALCTCLGDVSQLGRCLVTELGRSPWRPDAWAAFARCVQSFLEMLVILHLSLEGVMQANVTTLTARPAG